MVANRQVFLIRNASSVITATHIPNPQTAKSSFMLNGANNANMKKSDSCLAPAKVKANENKIVSQNTNSAGSANRDRSFFGEAFMPMFS